MTGTCTDGFEDMSQDIRRNTGALNENVRELKAVAQAWQINAQHNTKIQENLLDRMMALGGEVPPPRKALQATYVPEQQLIELDTPTRRGKISVGAVGDKTTRQLELELELLKRAGGNSKVSTSEARLGEGTEKSAGDRRYTAGETENSGETAGGEAPVNSWN